MIDVPFEVAEILGKDEDALAYEPAYPVMNGTVSVFAGAETGTAIVAYMSADPETFDYWEDHDGVGCFTECRSQGQYDAAVAEASGKGDLWFDVEVYRHGNVAYAVRGTGNFPDREWDVGPAGIFVPPEDDQKQYQAVVALARAAGTPDDGIAAYPAVAEFLAEAVRNVNGTLEHFSDACNGDVFGIVIETVRVDEEDGTAVVAEDACWRYIGYTQTKNTLDERVAGLRPPAPAFQA